MKLGLMTHSEKPLDDASALVLLRLRTHYVNIMRDLSEELMQLPIPREDIPLLLLSEVPFERWLGQLLQALPEVQTDTPTSNMTEEQDRLSKLFKEKMNARIEDEGE